MKKTIHQHQFHTSHFLANFLLLLIFSLLIAPDAMAGCNKFNKGKDCSLNPNPPVYGEAVFEIIDTEPCMCSGAPMPQFQAGPLVCNSGSAISNAGGDYYCTVSGVDEVLILTHHMSMMFNKKHAEICNSLAFAGNLPLHPDTDGEGVTFAWTEDCYDGTCGVEISMNFSGEQIMGVSNDAADSLNVILYGTMATVPEGNGNPFLLAQQVTIESMDFLFLKPGTTKSAGTCTVYPSGSLVFMSTPIEQP